MSNHLSLASTGGPRGRALISAKTVAWGLTAVTGASLLLGLAVVELLGRQTPSPELEKDPPPATRHSAPSEDAKPIFLESATARDEAPGAPNDAQPRDAGARYGARDASLATGVR